MPRRTTVLAGVHVLYYCAAGEGLEAAVELDEGTLVSEGGLEASSAAAVFEKSGQATPLWGRGRSERRR